MPQKITQADGTEIEVFTKEELETQAKEQAENLVAEERQKLEKEKTELATSKSELEEQLADAKDKLQKLEDKDHNFEQLRKKNNKDDEQKTELAKTVESLQKQISEIAKAPFATAKDSFIANNIPAEKKELKEKFDHYMGKLGEGVKTVEQMQAAMKEALILAGQGDSVSINADGKMIVTNPGLNLDKSQSGEQTEAGREFAQAFGITEEDRKKHGGSKVKLW